MSNNAIYNLNKRALKILEKYTEDLEHAERITEKKPLIKFIGDVFCYSVDVLGLYNEAVSDFEVLELQRVRLCKKYKKLKSNFSQEEQKIIEIGLNI